MKPVNETFELSGRERLVRRANRLVALLAQNAPKTIIADEVMIIVRAMEIYGAEEYYSALARKATEHWRGELGFCETPECHNVVLTTETLCYDCNQEMKAEEHQDEEDGIAPIEGPGFDCSVCDHEASFEIVHKDKRFWACKDCQPVLMEKLGSSARSAPFPQSDEEKGKVT